VGFPGSLVSMINGWVAAGCRLQAARCKSVGGGGQTLRKDLCARALVVGLTMMNWWSGLACSNTQGTMSRVSSWTNDLNSCRWPACLLQIIRLLLMMDTCSCFRFPLCLQRCRRRRFMPASHKSGGRDRRGCTIWVRTHDDCFLWRRKLIRSDAPPGSDAEGFEQGGICTSVVWLIGQMVSRLHLSFGALFCPAL
jgi:hypothetical protein